MSLFYEIFLSRNLQNLKFWAAKKVLSNYSTLFLPPKKVLSNYNTLFLSPKIVLSNYSTLFLRAISRKVWQSSIYSSISNTANPEFPRGKKCSFVKWKILGLWSRCHVVVGYMFHAALVEEGGSRSYASLAPVAATVGKIGVLLLFTALAPSDHLWSVAHSCLHWGCTAVMLDEFLEIMLVYLHVYSICRFFSVIFNDESISFASS